MIKQTLGRLSSVVWTLCGHLVGHMYGNVLS